ncbi:MFS transporter [Glutamicibacter protophormiae]|uniref:MFS transporter n=1 Tax=Glutamicibacter protophormiae TaxID=37930 RepID=UPI00227D5BF5|nr:MFS transporter [Glutamicibacter protophormiae]
MLTGWCANQYVSLISWYQQQRLLSEFEAMLVMGSYLLGMIPALMFGGPLADRFGRKPFTLAALAFSILGSVALMGGWYTEAGLYLGRVFTGLGMGLAMVAVTSWVKLISPGPAGATRAALCTSAGFAIGPAISGAIVGASQSPELAYAVHAVATLAWLLLMLTAKEEQPAVLRQVDPADAAPAAHQMRTSAANMKRFTRLVLPAAPWVFGMAATGFAVVPALTAEPGQSSLLYSTIAVVVTMGMGAAIQPLIRRFNDVSRVGLLLWGLGVALTGLLLMLVVSLTGSEAVGMAASVVSGAANGILLVAGLSQVLDLAGPADLGKLTGRFYMCCFIGFTFPTLFALWRPMAHPALFIGLLAICCVASMIQVFRARKYLPGRTPEHVTD